MWLEVCPKVCFSMSHPLSCPKKALADIFEHNGWVNCHLAIMLLSCPAFSWTTDVVAIASRPMSISKNQFVLPLVYCTVPLTKKILTVMAVTAKIGKISANHLILMRLVARLKQQIEKTLILYALWALIRTFEYFLTLMKSQKLKI